jgi:hypothetical protein
VLCIYHHQPINAPPAGAQALWITHNENPQRAQCGLVDANDCKCSLIILEDVPFLFIGLEYLSQTIRLRLKNIYIHTYHLRFIPEGVAEVSQIFLRDTHVLPK